MPKLCYCLICSSVKTENARASQKQTLSAPPLRILNLYIVCSECAKLYHPNVHREVSLYCRSRAKAEREWQGHLRRSVKQELDFPLSLLATRYALHCFCSRYIQAFAATNTEHAESFSPLLPFRNIPTLGRNSLHVQCSSLNRVRTKWVSLGGTRQACSWKALIWLLSNGKQMSE